MSTLTRILVEGNTGREEEDVRAVANRDHTALTGLDHKPSEASGISESVTPKTGTKEKDTKDSSGKY